MKGINTPLRRSLQPFLDSKFICRSCWSAGLKKSDIQSRAAHGATQKRPYKQDDQVSSIARHIQQTGKLPSLPTASTFELPTLRRQRKLRDKNIVRDDIKATVDAHYAANVLADGSIHLRLGESSYPEPRRLAIIPPDDILNHGHVNQQSTRCERHAIVLESEASVLGDGIQSNLEQPVKKDQEYIVSSEFYDRLLEIDPSLDVLQRLDAEIRVFQEWLEPNQEEHDAALDTWLRLQQAIGKQFPEFKFQLHGSRVSGLARPFSDIDVKLIIRKFDKVDDVRGPSSGRTVVRKAYMSALQRIKKWIEEAAIEDFTTLEIRRGSKPLLEIQDRTQGSLKLELSAAMGKPIEHNTEFVKYFLTQYPQIKPLFLLSRWWLENSGIGDASAGGISSYLTFCMILTSITHSEQSFHNEGLGEQFLHFLRFWTAADWKNLGFAPDPARTFPKFAVNIVEEPNPMNVTTGEFRSSSGQAITSSPMSTEDEAPNNDISGLSVTDQSLAKAIENMQDSDIYLQGIKFLTRQANSLHRTSDKKRAYFLLQDPADPRNNIGASLRRLPELQLLMKRALHRLEQGISSWDQRTTESSQARQFLLRDFIYVHAKDGSSLLHPDKAVKKLEKKRRRLAFDIAKTRNP